MDKIDKELQELMQFPGFKHNNRESIRGLNKRWIPLCEGARIMGVPCPRLARWVKEDPLGKLITKEVDGLLLIHKTACGNWLQMRLEFNPMTTSDSKKRIFW